MTPEDNDIVYSQYGPNLLGFFLESIGISNGRER